MKRLQYEVREVLRAEAYANLEDLARHGWELITVVHDRDKATLYLKRPAAKTRKVLR